MNKRNTKQKEIILEILDKNRTHPTIQEIYKLAREKYPTIGQATVYRNVNNLVDEKKIMRLTNTTDEGYHYDINTTPHIHLICNSCGKIIDIFDDDYSKIIRSIESKHSIQINKTLFVLEGICTDCEK